MLKSKHITVKMFYCSFNVRLCGTLGCFVKLRENESQKREFQYDVEIVFLFVTNGFTQNICQASAQTQHEQHKAFKDATKQSESFAFIWFHLNWIENWIFFIKTSILNEKSKKLLYVILSTMLVFTITCTLHK